MRNNVMAFKLGGPLEAKPQPDAAPRPSTSSGRPEPVEGRPAPSLFAGPIQDTNRIEVASYVRDSSQGGTRMYVDEYAFNIYRARVKAGTVVRWVNNGKMNHTIAAEDGSWTTPKLSPLEAGAITFDKPGEYTYICREHPWAKAQIIVTP